MPAIVAVRMPKWGLSMQEGAIVDWWKAEGDRVNEGDDLVDIETSKITNVCESPGAGVLRRIVAKPGQTLPVGALLAVLADEAAGEADLDAFIADFQSRFTPGDSDGTDEAALRLEMVQAGTRTIQIGRAGAGDALPVVLLHGYAGDLNVWLFNVAALAARGPVIAIDLPGHGGSSKDVGDGSLAVMANAVADTLAALGIGTAHLVGHSLGGAVAARLAADRPSLAASTTLICPAYLPGGTLAEDFLTGVAESQRARDLKPWLQMLTADPALITRDMVEDLVKAKRVDGAEDALLMLRDRMVAGDDKVALQADLPRLPRVLVIGSPGDKIVGMPDAAALPADWHVVSVERCGHLPQMEAASRVNELVLGWVEGKEAVLS
jgi:pyruvate dehydrogenase E2 component (dihydrolipoamide acetyltransferase)